MPKFSKRSLERLGQCHVDLQIIFKEVIKHYDCSILCGHRGKKEQDKAYKEGKSKLVFPKSKHNLTPSLAIDVVPYPIEWNDLKRFYYFGGFVKGIASQLLKEGFISHEIRWGGDWDSDNDFADQKFTDLPHFELKFGDKYDS